MATQANRSFADWYQLTTVRSAPELMPKRWAAVEALAKIESRAALIELVRLVHGSAPSDSSIRSTIADQARKLDASFSARDNDAELRILAGACLVEILKSPSNKADLCALGLVASAFPLGTGDTLLNEFLPHASQYLSDEALRVREPPSYSYLSAKDTTETLLQALPMAVADPTAQGKEFLTPLATAIDRTTKELVGELLALREESNMFWWVFGGLSRDLGKSFLEIGPSASFAIAAKELCDITRLYPGPRSAKALLSKVLRDAGDDRKPVSLSSAVNSIDAQWRKRWRSTYVPATAPELTPILTAIAKSLETDEPSHWVSAFTKATQVPDVELPLSDFAMQAYIECIQTIAAQRVKA